MTTIRNFCSKYKLEIFTTAIFIAAGILALLGRDAAFYNSITDILFFCSEVNRVIVGSLMFPLVALVLYVFQKGVRKKILSVVCAKVISEIIMIPFGININFHSDVFLSDLSGLFFIAADIILMISLWSEKNEKTVCGGVLSAVSVISLFTVAISSRNGDATIYIYRTLSTVLFYVSIFYGSVKFPRERVYKGIRTELKNRVKKEEEKIRLAIALFMFALSAVFTLCFVMTSGHRNLLLFKEKPIEVLCYLTWFLLYLVIGTFIFNSNLKISMLKNLIFAFCVAVITTATIMVLNSYGHLLEYNFWFGDEVNLRYYDFFVSDLTYAYGFGWLRYPVVFFSGFVISFIVFMIASKKQLNDINKIIDKLKASVCTCNEEFDDYEDTMPDFDFEKAKTPDKNWFSVFDGDTFEMDDQEYDILLTFDNEDETERYIVYTDYSLDDEEKIQIFASKYNPKVNPEKLLSIESDEEWESIQFLLDCAMEKARENVEKSKEEQVEVDTYRTLTAMSEALAKQAYDHTPFILSIVNTNGKGKVNICGDTKNALHLVDEILIAVSRRLKADGLNEMQAFEMLGIMAAGATDKVYEDNRKKRNPFSDTVSNDETQKINFDYNDFQEGD